MLAHRFSIAPMMDWTDRHCRVFHRGLRAGALLYTRWLDDGAVIHGDRARPTWVRCERAIRWRLQLGGSVPADLAQARGSVRISATTRSTSTLAAVRPRAGGRFGACLMAEPRLVGDGVARDEGAVRIPVTVKKCRIGIRRRTLKPRSTRWRTRWSRGADVLIVHARKAGSRGCAKENREVPPLDYERVYRLKRALPQVPIVTRGIGSIKEARRILRTSMA